jgi:5-methylcytosine-specific restriction endonuclease McrA
MFSVSEDSALTKTCKKCSFKFSLDSFPRDNRAKDGYRNICGICVSIAQKTWRKKNAAKIRENRRAFRVANADEIRLKKQLYYQENCERIKARVKANRDADPEKDRQACREWYNANKEYSSQKSLEWRTKNKEYELQKKREYYLSHKEQFSEYGKKRYEEKREEIIARINTYRKSHPEVYAALGHKRRARLASVEINDFTKEDWFIIKFAYNSCCAYCGKYLERLTCDHIIPLAKNGNNTAANIVPACRSCNSKKGVGPSLIPLVDLLYRHPFYQKQASDVFQQR